MTWLNNKGIFNCSLFFIFITGWLIQSSIFINWDVSWLTHLADRLLNEGIHQDNFFEINTPMSIYIYIPAVLFSKLTHLSTLISIRCYIFSLVVLSSFLCSQLLNHSQDKKLLLLVLTGILLIFPISQFGQREHMFLILTLPYLFLLNTQIAPNHPLNKGGLLIGVLAGIGFAIKPHFIFVLLLLEIYISIKQKKLFRIESLTIYFILWIYVLSVIYLQPTYLSLVIPLASYFYHPEFPNAWVCFSQDSLLLFILSVLIVYCFLPKKYFSDNFSQLIFLYTVGCVIAYLIQKTGSYYRLLPAFSMGFFLLAWLFWTVTLRHVFCAFIIKDILFILLLGIILFFIPIQSVNKMIHNAIHARLTSPLNDLFSFINSQPKNKSYYFISTSPPSLIREYTHSDAKYLSEYSLPYWLLSGILASNKHDKIIYSTNHAFKQSVSQIMDNYHPDYIFVDNRIVIHGIYNSFNYIDYFSTNSCFKKTWSNYQYLGYTPPYDIYKIKS